MRLLEIGEEDNPITISLLYEEVYMAGKKPSKPGHLGSVKEPEKPGKLVKYIGAYRGVFHTCPTCGFKLGKGFLFEFENVLYCTRSCIPNLK